MSSFVKASGGITPNSADPGEEFPFLHTITVVDRVVSVDKPELVQNNIKTETVTLNLDSEWEGLSTVINIGNERPVSVIWSGEPVVIPSELMTTVGYLDVSVVGYGDDGGIRAVTKKATSIFNVVASGFVEGDEAVPDPTTLLGQLIQAADVAAVTGGNRNNGFGDGDGWWIILLALLFGWGRNGAFGGGYGSGNGGCCAPATCAELQAGFNNQSVNGMLNGINSGICSLGYDVASQINGVNTNIMQNGYNTANAITQAQFAQQQSAAALQAQLADCCCQNREAISGVNYNMATSTNAVTTAISNAARDITENQNTNYRQLHDELVAYRMEDKDNTIAELRSQVNALNLSASQSNQNAYLVAQLKTPSPVPAYTVPNPNGYYGCQQNCYQSCGC